MPFARHFCALMGIAAVLAPGASAQTTYPPCAPGAPTPTFRVNGKTVPVYTTQDLLVRVKLGSTDFSVMSFDVSGVRPLEQDEEASRDTVPAIADAPGTLTANATLLITDERDGSSCTVSGTGSFDVRAATTPAVSSLRRPRVYKPDPKLTWDSEFRFTVRPGPTGDHRPMTVEARGIPRARVPGAGVRAGTRTFAIRRSDAVDDGTEERVLGTCSIWTLVCPKKVRTWPKGPEINVYQRNESATRKALEVHVTLPRGYPSGPRGLQRHRSPAGVDVKVIQAGRNIARLRIAGLCQDRGQYSFCRYKKLTTAL